MIGLYIHVPYCRTLCPYCDFFSVDIAGSIPAPFIDALCREIKAFPQRVRAQTVFFGGGTPSLLDEQALAHILDALRTRFDLAPDAEISLEANPDDIRPQLIDAWKRVSINRVSLGVQSFNEDTLRYLGRRHGAQTALQACEMVADAFDNWSMDLIFGAPPVEAWKETLHQSLALRPRHVSTYGLTYEPETPFARRAHEAIEDTTWLRLYREADASLHAYRHYEISNYALPGYECRHNLIYWHNNDYAGFGPGAYSFFHGERSRNVENIDRYLSEPGTKEETLSLTPREVRVETLIQHFRLHSGLAKEDYRLRFGMDIRPEFASELDRLIARGLLVEDEDRIAPTEQGFELNNEIGLELVG